MNDLGAVLDAHACAEPNRRYVESIEQGAGLTFGELDVATLRLAHLLADRGVRPGDRVSILADNSREFVVLFFGIQRFGATVNPVNTEVNAKNVAQILEDVDPQLVFLDRAVPDEVRDSVAASRRATIAFDAVGAGEREDLFAMLEAFRAAWDPAPVDPDAVAIIDHTSGTTARPKGVCISHRAYFGTCRAMAQRLGLGHSDRMLECRALSWASPQTLTLGPSVHAGAGLVVARKFSRRRFFEWIRRDDVTIAAAVPTILSMLCERPLPVTGADLPRLRFVTSSSAPLAPERQLEFERRYRIPVIQGGGMTEIAGFLAINPPSAPRLGSLGPPMPYVTARFVNETGRVCGPNEEGELVVGGSHMATAYLADGGVTVPIPQEEFATGDLGYMDADGYLYITGRKKDLIIRGGVNIAPREITSVLLDHAAVAEAATIGVPNPVYGEAIVSFVRLRAGACPTPAELLEHCRVRLSPFKVPERILVVDAIPRTGRGKHAREGLLALLARTSEAPATSPDSP